MGISRHFLGWEAPCLPAAVTWLGQRFSSGEAWDLSRTLLVVPGARAGRRLLELLAAASPGKVLHPPEITTAGSLADHLVDLDRVASPVESLLIHAHALRCAPSDLLTPLLPSPPAADDFKGMLALASQLQMLHETLMVDDVALGEVCERCESLDGFAHGQRWEGLASLRQAVDAALARAERADRLTTLREAARERQCAPGAFEEIVLIGVADMRRLVQRLLRAAPLPVTALVHAPDEHADGFDDTGCVVAPYWQSRCIPLRDEALHVVDRPVDQSMAVIRNLATLTAADPEVTADDVTIGLGDESEGEGLARMLELAGIPAHLPAGRSPRQSRPALLLAQLATFLETRTLEDLASLLRCSDLDAYLEKQLPAPDAVGLIASLDAYRSEHLQETVGPWIPSRAAQPERQSREQARIDRLEAAVAMIDALMAQEPGAGGSPLRRPLTAWPGVISSMLITLFDGHRLHRHAPSDAALVQSLEAIGGVLRELAGLPEGAEYLPQVTVSEALWLILSLLDGQRTQVPQQGAAVELLGWLELQLDDAPHLLLTSMNEGCVPASQAHDAFLPDRMRMVLGLAGNELRHARDVYILSAIVASRPSAVLLASRRDAEGEPRAPSRLLLACPPEAMASRIDRFYDSGAERPLAVDASLLLPCAPQSAFLPPAPQQAEPLSSLRVTAFRDYIACPYRFYLRHVRKLEAVDDQAVEMGGDLFGSLAHHVLERFGESDVATATDAARIARALGDLLDTAVHERFGPQPRAVVILQREQLRRRLGAFATWQAQSNQEGWHIVTDDLERELQAVLHVGDCEFQIVGRIDRIDRHEDGGLRLLDYKTADSGDSPDRVHRRKLPGERSADAPREWIDLQLPLYAELARQNHFAGDLSLGYITLPKDLGQVGLQVADWTPDDLQSALQRARAIIADIRAGIFWPPADPPLSRFDDGLGGLCFDGTAERQEVIERVTRQLDAGESP